MCIRDRRFTALLEKYGGASESALAYLHDKRLFWYRVDGQDQVVFQFAQTSNLSLIHISDVVIPEGVTNTVAIDLINTKVASILKESQKA